jgi:hypothetical protein
VKSVVATRRVPVGTTLAGVVEAAVVGAVDVDVFTGVVEAAEVAGTVVVLLLLLQDASTMTITARMLRHRNRKDNLCFFK